MTTQTKAAALAEALTSSVGTTGLAVDLLEAVGDDAPRWFDVGPGGVELVVLAGWGPLDNPLDYVVFPVLPG